MSPFLPRYLYCKNCQFIALDSAFILSREDEKKHYTNHKNSLENLGYIKMFETFINFVDSNITNYNKVLDFGSGTNPVLATLLKRKGKEVFYYDPYFSPDMSYEDHFFDLITITEVFEHLADPKETLKHLVSLLNPNGSIAIMTHFHENYLTKFEKWWYRIDPTHIGFFTPKTFSILASKTGLYLKAHDEKKSLLLSI
ncbi:MAG: class I SAM-dependent methyltransferase [Campylobacteraceae bacterium]|nr:class I SAM-dependent methyltransferase [Campylobacteraceae bacterium]